MAEKTLNEDTSLPHAICEPRQAECGEGSIRSEAAGVRTSTTVVPLPPLRRAAGTRFLPVPVAGGSIEVLRSFLNVQADNDFVLVVAWPMAGLRNRGPYPVLIVCGEQGSAKSNFTAIMRSLLDPNTAPLRTMPRDARDLFIAASNSHVLAFDNVSCVPDWISDTLCRLSTGGGFATRQLYTNQDEVLFDAARPVILNGIEDMVRRPDLADRRLFLTLEAIPENRRRPQAELSAAFEAERPRILGGLLDAAVKGLKRLPTTRLPNLPRMADFAIWVTACEMALWSAGTFAAAYNSNRDEAIEAVIEADRVAAAVRTLAQARTVWTGTATDLLVALQRRWMSELPGPRTGRIALRPCRAGCAVRQRSCERAASRLSSIAWERSAPEPSPLPIPISNLLPRGTGPSAPSAPSPYVRITTRNGQDIIQTGARTSCGRSDANFPIQSGPGKPTTPG